MGLACSCAGGDGRFRQVKHIGSGDGHGKRAEVLSGGPEEGRKVGGEGLRGGSEIPCGHSGSATLKADGHVG